MSIRRIKKKIKREIENVTVKDNIYKYIVNLVNETRNNSDFEIGLSTRSSIDLLKASKTYAYMNDRNYVIPSDIRNIFINVCKHRVIKSSHLNNKKSNEELLSEVIKMIKVPDDKE